MPTTPTIVYDAIYGMSSTRALPAEVNVGGVAWFEDSFSVPSPTYPYLVVGDTITRITGVLGFALDSAAASDVSLWLDGIKFADVRAGEYRDLPIDIPKSIVVTSYVPIFALRVSRLDDFNGELLSECPFTIASLELQITTVGPPAPDPEPGSACFWTDFERTREVCGAAPPEPNGFAHFWGTDQNGSGSSSGRVAVTYRDSYGAEPDFRSYMVCSTPMFEALLGAEGVYLTGYAVADGLEVVDAYVPGEAGSIGGAPAGYDTCQVPVDPDTVPWTSVDHAMAFYEFGNTSEYRWFNDGSLSQGTWYYVRINVDGTSYYGVICVGGGI